MNRNSNRPLMPSMDQGPAPFVTDIEKMTRQNTNYRTALWTGQKLQLTLMCIPAGDEIGLEVHPDTEQFLRIENGSGMVMMGPSENRLHCKQPISDGCAVLIPAGTWHNIVNTGTCPLKLYTIYAPPHHPRGIVQSAKACADAHQG